MRASGVVLLLAFVLLPTRARAADSVEACARAAEAVQLLRGQGKLNNAIGELRTCLRTVCPEVIRRDCAEWQVEVEASMPTVILSAHSVAGDDVVDAHASVDGRPFLDKLDGIARSLDPGLHRLRFEKQGSAPVEVEVVLREGEKRRLIPVTFAPEATREVGKSGPSREALVPRTLAPSPPSTESRPSSVLPWAFGGLGAASLVGFAAIGMTGLSDLHALRDGCGRSGTCAPSTVASIRTRLWLADGLFGAALLSTSLAGWLWLRPPTKGRGDATAVRIAVCTGPGLLLERRF
ncbi:MAG: hypothetical protein M3O50_17420 [Myxococcota bacterium]|nr:hypothetical protein [Myxococcota bacterium]